LLPAAKRRGRPRTDLLLILNAILYILCEGCTWRGLPGDFPTWQTVYTYFRDRPAIVFLNRTRQTVVVVPGILGCFFRRNVGATVETSESTR
jgi:transposase